MGRETDHVRRKEVLFSGPPLGQIYLGTLTHVFHYFLPHYACHADETDSFIPNPQVMDSRVRSQTAHSESHGGKMAGGTSDRYTMLPQHLWAPPHVTEGRSELLLSQGEDRYSWISNPFSSPMILDTKMEERKKKICLINRLLMVLENI